MFTAVFTQNRKLSGWVSPRLSFLRDYQWQGYCLLFVVVLILSSVSSTQHYPVIYKSDSSHRYNCPCPVLSLSRSLLFSPQTREKLSPIVPFLPLLCSDLSCSGGGGDMVILILATCHNQEIPQHPYSQDHLHLHYNYLIETQQQLSHFKFRDKISW